MESLKAQSVDVVFGVISVHNLGFFDALYDSQDSVKYVGGRLELASGFMADGYSRASGKPGVFVTSTGPGAADSMGAMGEAYYSGSAVLQLTTNVEKDFINSGRGIIHEPRDQVGMFRSVTDWNALITEVESIPDYVQEAFGRFQTRRPRPIELEIPTDLLRQETDVEVAPALEVAAPKGDPDMIEKAAEVLLKARRPIILVGDELNFCAGTQELVALAEAMGAPVAISDGSKGAFPDDHHLAIGQTLVGWVWGVPHMREFMESCDVALVVGSVLPHKTTQRIKLKLPEQLVHIAMDGNVIGKNYPASVPIVANPREGLRQILDLMKGRDAYKGDGYRSEVVALKKNIEAGGREKMPNEMRAFDALRSVLPRDTVTCWDSTVPLYRGVCGFPAYGPRTFMYAHGWAGLGFGFPSSLGAKVAKPQTPVVCVTGDGGFQYNMQELGTAAQYGISPVVVMFNDNAWGVLRQGQVDNFNRRVIGTDLVNPDFVKLFDAYGFESTRVSTLDGLVNALGTALGSGRLQLIEVGIPSGFGNFR